MLYTSTLIALLVSLSTALHLHPLTHKADNNEVILNQFHDQMTSIRKSISGRIQFFKNTNSEKYKSLIDYNEKLLAHWDNLYQLAEEQKVYFTSDNHICVNLLPTVIKSNMLTQVHQIFYFLEQYQKDLKACKDCDDIKSKRGEIDSEIQNQFNYVTIIDHTINEAYCSLEKSRVKD